MIGAALLAAMAATPPAAPVRLAVPIVRQAPERCGPAALAMVFRFHGGGPGAVAAAERAYDPVLRGALVTEMARVAREAGFVAEVERPGPDSLIALLARGVPPILLYETGRAALTRQHYGVLVGWDPVRGQWEIHDGGPRPRRFDRRDLVDRWRAVGGLALVVRPAPR